MRRLFTLYTKYLFIEYVPDILISIESKKLQFRLINISYTNTTHISISIHSLRHMKGYTSLVYVQNRTCVHAFLLTTNAQGAYLLSKQPRGYYPSTPPPPIICTPQITFEAPASTGPCAFPISGGGGEKLGGYQYNGFKPD